jgi:hypothetical protein
MRLNLLDKNKKSVLYSAAASGALNLFDTIEPLSLRHKVAEAQFYLPFERLEQLQVPDTRHV